MTTHTCAHTCAGFLGKSMNSPMHDAVICGSAFANFAPSIIFSSADLILPFFLWRYFGQSAMTG